MHRIYPLLPALASFAFARPQPGPQAPAIKAIVPTATGQIGVNPVVPLKYIGVDTQYYTIDSTSTRWIGVNSVIVETITQPTATITTSAVVAISTATAASDGVAVGDLSFIITPAGKDILESLFEGAEAACGPLKKRQSPNSCAIDYIQANAAPEVSEQLSTALLDGAGNLVEFLFTGVEEGSLLAELSAGFDIVAAFGTIAYASWKLAKIMPDGVKIPKTNIKTTTATTTSSSRSSTLTLLPETFMTDFFNPYPTPADTNAASAMATALQARFVSLEAATTVSSSTNCVCTQVVASDGTKGNLNCPIATDGENLDCSIVTSTQAPAPPPTKTPLPDPAPAATCNQGRPLPDYAEDITFNRDAAKSAIAMFCHDNPYSYAKNAVQTCPSWQSYAFEGSTVNSGGQSGVLGPSTRIYLAMRWDLVDCTNNDWWSVNNEQDSPAGKYLDGPTLYDDCVAGFNAALGGCETPGDTHGSKDTYKCMEYFLFPSTSSNLELPCNNLPW